MSTYNTYNVEKYNLGIDLSVAHGMAETGPRGWIPGSTCIFPYWSDDFIPNIILMRFYYFVSKHRSLLY